MNLFKKKEESEEVEEIEEKKVRRTRTPRERWMDFLNIHHLNVEEFFDMLRDKKIVYDFDRWRCAALFKSMGQDFDMTFGNLLCGRLWWQNNFADPQSEALREGPRFSEVQMSDHVVFLFLKMWFSDGEYFKVSKQKVKEYFGDREAASMQWDEFLKEAKEFVERYGSSVLDRTR